ncbi:conserved protein, unknown function [Hepatocystis sp. ex Piliocolobus tephrosceles]|nr:conserved protein, unknown function [Hepatocystis sp. ex Piliocolobus tephrosceles]
MRKYSIMCFNMLKKNMRVSFGSSWQRPCHCFINPNVIKMKLLSTIAPVSPSASNSKKEKNVSDKDKTKSVNKQELKNVYKIKFYFKEYKIHIVYYTVFFLLFSIFSYCVIKILYMIFEEPIALKLVKQKVLEDKQLLEEYDKEILFSRFWTGYINDQSARIVVNIKSKKNEQNGKIISNLINKNNTWVIKTLTYYNKKKSENLQTPDLKTLLQNTKQTSSSCPIHTETTSKKKN